MPSVHRRFEVRRAVHLTCAVRSELWDGPAPFLATDLSASGLRLCSPLALPEGQDVVVTFTPPRWGEGGPINALARVTHVALPRRAEDRLLAQLGVAGMGLSFSHIDPTSRALLTLALRGLPPPLPLPEERTRASLATKAPEALRAHDELETLLVHDGLEIVLRAEAPLLGATQARTLEQPLERAARAVTHAATLRRRFRSYRFRTPHQRGASAHAERRCPSLELVS